MKNSRKGMSQTMYLLALILVSIATGAAITYLAVQFQNSYSGQNPQSHPNISENTSSTCETYRPVAELNTVLTNCNSRTVVQNITIYETIYPNATITVGNYVTVTVTK